MSGMLTPSREFVLKSVFENVSEMEEDVEQTSAQQMHFNVPWSIEIVRKNEYLACYLYCDLVQNACAWSIGVEYEFRITSNNGRFRSKLSTSTFRLPEGIGFPKFVTWDRMMAEFVTDGRLVVEVTVRILRTRGVPKAKVRDFGNPNDQDFDTIIEIDDEQFHVSKTLLTNRSKVLKDLLNKDDKPTGKTRKRACLTPRVKLEDVIPYHFQYFLEVLNLDTVIDDENVIEILGVAVKFEANNVIRMCETFLYKESKIALKEKFELIGKFKLENLKTSCLTQLEQKNIRSVLSGNVESMGGYLLSALLQKFLENTPPLQADRQKPSVKKDFVMTHFISNSSKMAKDKEFFGEVGENSSLKWQLSVTKREQDFGFNLRCNYAPLGQSEWLVYVDFTFKLNSINGREMALQGKYEFGSKAENPDLACIKKADFELYLVDDCASFEVHVKITKMEGIKKQRLMKFDESKKEMSDITFVVGDEKFYLSKRSLEQQSQYFNSLLFGNLRVTSSEVVVPNVDPEDFQNFLEVYFGKLYIDDSTISGIWRLGDMYGAEDVNKRCEEFVIEKSEMSLKDKLNLASRCNSKFAKMKLLAEIQTAADIQSVLSEKVEDMDASILASLLVKAIDLWEEQYY